MSDQQPAVIVKDLYKSFKLPHEQHSGIKQRIINIFKGVKGYETQHVLNDISFEIKKGEFFGVVGRNGSGKSTLLKLLAGTYVSDKGLVQVNGSLTPFIELGVGFNPELTGRENVFLNGALLGFSAKEMEAMYDDIVGFAELPDFMDQKLKNYSSGMQVRLAFSIAIRAKSDILLLDEVLAVGDAAFQKKCFDYFRELKKNKKTVVFISHDMNAVREYCDRVIMLDAGTIIAEGSPDDVAMEYTKLFMRGIDNAQNENPSKRWGNGDARINNVKIVSKNQQIYVKATITFMKDDKDPVVGFSLKSPIGNKIVENNTKWLHMNLGRIKKNEIIAATWIVPDILSNGHNVVTVAVCDRDASVYYDWYEDAAVITTDKDQITTALTIPGDKIEIARGLA